MPLLLKVDLCQNCTSKGHSGQTADCRLSRARVTLPAARRRGRPGGRRCTWPLQSPRRWPAPRRATHPPLLFEASPPRAGGTERGHLGLAPQRRPFGALRTSLGSACFERLSKVEPVEGVRQLYERRTLRPHQQQKTLRVSSGANPKGLYIEPGTTVGGYWASVAGRVKPQRRYPSC